jgi:periplasmic divalent cation tolerance protein
VARTPESPPDPAEVLQVTTTLGSQVDAERIGRILVEERLAACAQIIGPVSSVYWWEEGVESAREWYCHLKTVAERFDGLLTRLRSLHPYEVAEIIAVPVTRISPEYAHWVAQSVRLPSS